jgi:hypothetical protein
VDFQASLEMEIFPWEEKGDFISENEDFFPWD